MTKAELESMYKSMTIDQLEDKLQVSRPTIYRLLKDNNIKLKGNAGNRKKIKVVG